MSRESWIRRCIGLSRPPRKKNPSAFFLIPGEFAGGKARAKVLHDGRTSFGIEFCDEGGFKLIRPGKQAKVLTLRVPVSLESKIPYGLHDVPHAVNGDGMIVVDISKAKGKGQV